MFLAEEKNLCLKVSGVVRETLVGCAELLTVVSVVGSVGWCFCHQIFGFPSYWCQTKYIIWKVHALFSLCGKKMFL